MQDHQTPGEKTNIAEGQSRSSEPDPEELLDGAIPRRDFVRLLIDSLQQLGYRKASKVLEEESGIALEKPIVTKFKEAVMNGDWDLVESIIPELKIEFEDDVKMIKFYTRRQKYLELLEKRKISEAVNCLRNELSPIGPFQELHHLSSLLMCTSGEEVRRRAMWDGASGKSRSDLLYNLHKYISPQIMVPKNRLQNLIKQAAELQNKKCIYHNAHNNHVYLFEDHHCDRYELPSQARQVLTEHTDEVWFVKFSSYGKYFASASKDATCIIWRVTDTNEAKVHRTITGHGKPIAFVAWSPDDSLLLTCGEKSVGLWDVSTGECKRMIKKHTDIVTCCAWLPDGKRFVTGGLDSKIFLWDVSGTELRMWDCARVNDLCVTRDGKWMIVVCQEKKIRYFNLLDEHATTHESYIQEHHALTSLALSRDSKYLLVNVSSQSAAFVGLYPVQEIHLYDVENKKLIQKYTGQKQSRFVIRSCFGGANQNFILSGSEDSLMYLWHRQSGSLLRKYEGHTGSVNCVDWSPIDPYLFVSASDDGTLRVWSREIRVQKRRRDAMEEECMSAGKEDNGVNDSFGECPKTNNSIEDIYNATQQENRVPERVV
jgi:WD40 repeat protein